jgi:hypothetical protein
MLVNRCYHRKGWILSNTCCYTNFDLKALYKLLNGAECHSRHYKFWKEKLGVEVL